MELPLSMALKLADKEADEMLTEKAWQLYLTVLPHQDPKKKPLTFESILRKMNPFHGKKKTSKTSGMKVTDDMMNVFNDFADLKKSER